jgi:glycosyltransferase involved in cell wall biosynthesis
MLSVSVIIPAYNAAATLAETIASLQAQTSPHWESIVVDDGSTDETGAIAQNLAQQDPRIRYILQANSGVCTTRNTGINAAQFDWLLFLDADDWIAPEHLAKMTAVLATDESFDAVHCGWSRVAADGTIVGEKYSPDHVDLFPELASYCTFHINACVMRKSLVVEVGGFDPAIPYCEDWDLWQRMARMGAKFAAIRDVLGFYRMRPNSLSSHAAAFCRDGLTVLKNACHPDPRVPHPHPDYVAGLSDQMLLTRQCYFITWCAGLLLGKGEEARSLLTMMDATGNASIDPEWIAANLFETVPIPTSQPPQAWYQLCQQHWGLIQEFLKALEQRIQIVGLSDRSLYLLEQKILQHCGHEFPITLAQSYGVTIDASHPIPTITLPASTQHLYARITLQGAVLGQLKLPVCDQRASAAVIARAIAAQFLEPILNALLQSIQKNGPAGFFQHIWRRSDWPLVRFYDLDCPDFDHDSPTIVVAEDWLELDIQDELPHLQVVQEFVRVSLKLANITIGTLSFAGNTIITPNQIRAAFSQSFAPALQQAFVRSQLFTDEPASSALGVSIVIPAYNAAPYFRQTLTALVAQTYADWEAIIIDDGSWDETAAIAVEFAQQDSRIRVIRQSNQGGCQARNRGLQQAYFDWVVFLDADDWWEPSYLEIMMAQLAADPSWDGVRCDWHRVNADGQDVLEAFTVSPIADAFHDCVLGCGWQIDTCIVRRSLVQAIGGFDPAQKASQDWDLWQRIARTGARFAVVNQTLSYYRTVASSVSSQGLRLFSNGWKVIERGHTIDARVSHPDPRYANGLEPTAKPLMQFYFMLWCAGLEIAQYRDARPFLTQIDHTVDPDINAQSLADGLRSLWFSTGLARDHWYTKWQDYESGLFQFLVALESYLQKPGIAQQTIAQFKYSIFQAKSLPSMIGSTEIVHLDIFQPLPNITSTAQTVYCLVNLNGDRLGELELPLHQGELSATVLADAIAGEFFWRILGYFYRHNFYSDDQNHDEMGWTTFLQDLCDRPDWESAWFYDSESDRDANSPILQLDQPQCQIEVSQDLPMIVLSPELSQTVIEIIFTIAGQPIGVIPCAVVNHQITVAALRSTLLNAAGLELCRLYVREAIIGQPLQTAETLRQRLQNAAKQHRQLLELTCIPPISSCWRILREEFA